MDYSDLILGKAILIFSICILFLSVFSNRAHAITATFDFTPITPYGNPKLMDSVRTLYFTHNDITLDMSAATYERYILQGKLVWGRHYTSDIVTISDEFEGLGIRSYGNGTSFDYYTDWITQTKRNGESEYMFFDFNKELYLTDISYTVKDDLPGFELAYAYDVDGDGVWDVTNVAPTGPISSFAVTSWNDRYSRKTVYDFAVNSITVSDTAPSVAPLPAALPLYGAGTTVLGLLGSQRRKQQANA